MAPSAASNGSCPLRECWPKFVDKVAMPRTWREADPCGGRDRRNAHSADKTFSADGSRGQDEDQGDGQVCSRTPGCRVGSEDQGCISSRSRTKQRGTPSWRVDGQRAGWTRMGQGFAPSRSPSVGNSTGQSCCHPNPVLRSPTKGRYGPHCSGHGAAEP